MFVSGRMFQFEGICSTIHDEWNLFQKLSFFTSLKLTAMALCKSVSSFDFQSGLFCPSV